MKKITLISILLPVCFLLAANGFGQQQQSPQNQTMQSQQSPQGQTKQEQQGSQSGQQLQWAQKSSDVLEKKILSKDGKELGTAEDLVIGKDGKIEYVILSTGGLLGIGGDKVAVPWDKIKSTPNVDQLTADMTQSEIQKISGKKESGDKSDSQKTAKIDPKKSAMPFAQVDLERAKEFMDKKVIGKDGEELGKVADLFTSEDGKPMYVIVEGESEKLHPVPAQLIRIDPEDKNLLTDLDKPAFQSSPSFDEEQISQQQQWEPKVRGYYQGGFQGRQQQQTPSGMGQSGPPQYPQGTGQSRQLPPPVPGAGQIDRQQPPPGTGQIQNQ